MGRGSLALTLRKDFHYTFIESVHLVYLNAYFTRCRSHFCFGFCESSDTIVSRTMDSKRDK